MRTGSAARATAPATNRLTGHASVFYDPADPGTEYTLERGPGFHAVERIMPGCFARALKEKDDVIFCLNHDSDLLLARTRSGSLRLREDERGLAFDADLVDGAFADEILALCERGDLPGASFCFSIDRAKWREVVQPDRSVLAIREILSVQLRDVSVVTRPAYASATCGIGRSAPPATRPSIYIPPRRNLSLAAFQARVRARAVEVTEQQ